MKISKLVKNYKKYDYIIVAYTFHFSTTSDCIRIATSDDFRLSLLDNFEVSIFRTYERKIFISIITELQSDKVKRNLFCLLFGGQSLHFRRLYRTGHNPGIWLKRCLLCSPRRTSSPLPYAA